MNAVGAERERLRSAWSTARKLGRRAAERVAGLPAELRALGVGQVLVALMREGERELVVVVVTRMVEVMPELGRGGREPREVANAWAEVEQRADVLRVESDLVAWASDLKLLLALPGRPSVDPTPVEGGPSDRADQRARAAVARLDVLSGCATRCRSLPVDLRESGLLRTLALLARESQSGSRDDRSASDRLLRALHERLVQEAGAPQTVEQLAEVLVSPGPQADVLQAVALAWVAQIKLWLDVSEAGGEG